MDSPTLFHPRSPLPSPCRFWSAVESVCREIQAIALTGHDPFTHDSEQDAAMWHCDLEDENGFTLLADLECYLAAGDPWAWVDRLLEAVVNRGKAVHWLFQQWGARVADFRELAAIAETCRLVAPLWEGKSAWQLPHAAAFLAAAWRRIRALSCQGVLSDAPEEPAVGDWREARNALVILITYCRSRGGEWPVEWPVERFRSNGRWRWQATRPIRLLRFDPLELGPCDGGNTCPPHTPTSTPQPATPRWDEDTKSLYYGDRLCKQYRRPAYFQWKILQVFQEEAWPRRIDDPLDGGELRRTLDSLSKSLSKSPIRFGGDGTGEGVVWTAEERSPADRR